MFNLFIKNYPACDFPWKLYFKGSDGKGYLIGGYTKYKYAKNKLSIMKADVDYYTWDKLQRMHTSMKNSSIDPNNQHILVLDKC